jgi:hypothetical protein
MTKPDPKTETTAPAAEAPPADYAGTPALEVPVERAPGAGEVVVVSPTGIRSVVSEDAVASLKTQGYKLG